MLLQAILSKACSLPLTFKQGRGQCQGNLPSLKRHTDVEKYALKWWRCHLVQRGFHSRGLVVAQFQLWALHSTLNLAGRPSGPAWAHRGIGQLQNFHFSWTKEKLLASIIEHDHLDDQDTARWKNDKIHCRSGRLGQHSYLLPPLSDHSPHSHFHSFLHHSPDLTSFDPTFYFPRDSNNQLWYNWLL